MKTKQRKKVLWVVVIISIALLIWLFQKRPRTSREQTASSVAITNAVVITNPPASEPRTSVQNTGLSAAVLNADPQRKRAALLSMIDDKNSPVDFYARVVDQDEQGVPGVKISMILRRWILSTNQSDGAFPITGEWEECDLVSDASGCFQITGKYGDNLELKSIEKSGYELSPRQYRSFAPSSGNLESPTIIRMWKKGQAEPLILNGKFFGTVPDGCTNMIGLVTGKKTQSAKLDEQSVAISVQRPANASNADKYDWSVKIQMAGGGFLESTDEFMYQAPESGYKPNLVFQFKKDDPEWTSVIKKRFFIKTPNGWHGHIYLEIYPLYDGEAAFQLNSVINPSGSRNLEYDPAVQPKPKVYE